MSDKLKQIIKEEWRQLGYHYDIDNKLKKWIFTASPFGLQDFVYHIENFADQSTSNTKSEHEHFGPYEYLKIMIWDSPGIDKDSIYGSREDLLRLAAIIKKHLTDENICKTITIRDKYTETAEYSLELNIQEYGFDPATCDEQPQ